jgi:hypothetical protein
MDLSYFGIALGTLFLSKRNSTKNFNGTKLFFIALGTCFLGKKMCNKVNGTIWPLDWELLDIGLGTLWSLDWELLGTGLGTLWALDWELFGHWIGNSLDIGLGTCLSLGKRCQKVNRTYCSWIGELVDFGRWHVQQSQWDTICQGSGRCGWMKPFFRGFFFT